MFNIVIAIILLYALFSGTKVSDYRIKATEIPWWLLVVIGFTISLLGLFYFNDERILFAGCGVLFIAKIISWFEGKSIKDN